MFAIGVAQNILTYRSLFNKQFFNKNTRPGLKFPGNYPILGTEEKDFIQKFYFPLDFLKFFTIYIVTDCGETVDRRYRIKCSIKTVQAIGNPGFRCEGKESVMEISLIGKTKALQPQTTQEAPKASKDEKSIDAPRVDSSDISAGHANAFEDKRLSVAKSTILYDVSLSAFSDRLEDIRGRVEDGSYEAPAAELADALLG
jgi:anti-sigma28 factor (negative regulator of flagellin synthesis)